MVAHWKSKFSNLTIFDETSQIVPYDIPLK